MSGRKRDGPCQTQRRWTYQSEGRSQTCGRCLSKSKQRPLGRCLDCSYLLSSDDLPTFHHLNVMLTMPCIQDATHRDPEVDRGRPLNLACQASSNMVSKKGQNHLYTSNILKRCKYQIMHGLHGP